MPKWVVALLQSRKFWLALLGVIGGIILYAQGAIAAEALVNLIIILVSVLVGSIAAEDVAMKIHGNPRPV